VAAGGCLLVKYLWDKFKVNQENQRYREERVRNQEFLESQPEVIIDQVQCVICTVNLRNVILMPCKHYTICSDCFEVLDQTKCPMCRSPIESTIRVFLS
jgi:hypothetical protein